MAKKGIALILAFISIIVLTILSIAILSRSISENYNTRRYSDMTQAFWLAEAGVNRALEELRTNFSQSGNNLWSQSLTPGEYTIDVAIDGQNRIVTSHGHIPSITDSRQEYILEATMSKSIPAGFYDNAMYSGGNIDLNGSSYVINGDVTYGGTIDADHPENITGTSTQDSSASPLARFNFQQVRNISQTQGNIYDAARLHQVQTGSDTFPSSFWYSRADDGIDNDHDGITDDSDEWVPNVIYVESDLQLNGNIGTIGGLFIVVGDVITNPDGTEDATINGNGQIDGAIYTRGEFRINGGGGNLNINGGVWTGTLGRINGNATITYNSTYLTAIENLSIDASVQIANWKDLKNPYLLTP